MSYEKQIDSCEIGNSCIVPLGKARDIARQADAEVERLRGKLALADANYSKLGEMSYKLSVELSAIKSASGTEDPIALIEIAKQCPITHDGFRFIPSPDDEFWCVYRECDTEDWKVSKCRTPNEDEWSMAEAEWDHSFGHPGWIVFDAEDDCQILGVYKYEQAAREAKEKGDDLQR